MDKTLKEMIRDIKKSSERGKLVVFIGAGVSVNSGYKLWDNLIGIFNRELNYSSKKDQFTTDEMLKIPQFFYNKNKERYFELIRQEYGKTVSQTNAIIDSVLRLNPVHIVTTNFDLLIEKSLEDNHIYGNTVYGNLDKYSIIRGDNDFVRATKGNYLIKMHGDVKSLENLVLKEEDYLQFSYTHTLIETFIKSLFVNNTFLFVGYGLGDYNLKLIMSWVESILTHSSEESGVDRFSYYFINPEQDKINDFEKEYFRKKNIFIIEGSEIADDFWMPHTPKNDEGQLPFEDYRGNNLVKVCNYIQFGGDNDLAEIIKDLSIFEDIDCITTYELMSKLGTHSTYHYMSDSTLNYRTDLFSIRLKTAIDKIKSNDGTPETSYLTSVFYKAGIRELISTDDEPAFRLDTPSIATSRIYDNVIYCDIDMLHKISTEDVHTPRELLQSGYILALMDCHEKAKEQFRQALSHYKKENDFFYMLINYHNLSKVEVVEKQVWYILVDKLSSDDKKTFRTLYDYLNDSNELFKETVETLKELEQKFDVNYHSISWDESNIPFTKLRYLIHQTQRYFIENSIYIKGYSGGTHIIGNWLKSLDYYVEILIMLHSSNVRMTRKDKSYIRNALKKEDLYLLITHPESRQLKFFMEKYNIRRLAIEPGIQEYVIDVLNNHIIGSKFERIVRFRFAHHIKNILSLIPLLDFNDEHYILIFKSLSKLLMNIMLIPYEKRDYYFTVFHDVVPAIIECIFLLLQRHKEQLSEVSLRVLIEDILSCIDSSSDVETLKYYIANLNEHSILLNLSMGLNFYFKGRISQSVSDGFFNTIEDRAPLKQFIIELFPVLSDSQKEQWGFVASSDIASIEPVFIQFAIINGVFEYNDNVSSILINRCKQQVKAKGDPERINIGRTPLHCVLRLVEKDFITDISPYREFIGYYDLFDFVCFPEEFDYEKFDTGWGSWLTLDRIREPAFAQAYDKLKGKYKESMLNGPSEIEKAVYYKYFYFEDLSF